MSRVTHRKAITEVRVIAPEEFDLLGLTKDEFDALTVAIGRQPAGGPLSRVYNILCDARDRIIFP